MSEHLLKVIVASQRKSPAATDFTARQVSVSVRVCESWVYDCVEQHPQLRRYSRCPETFSHHGA